MLKEKLKHFNIILASGSPRRQDLFQQLDIDFSIDVKKIDEVYPSHLRGAEISDYLSQQKARAFPHLGKNDLLITSDTIVWFDNKALGKPSSAEEAVEMLQLLSGNMHEVITSVCFSSVSRQTVVHDKTRVWFKDFTQEEVEYYVENFRPFDKAGGYGIQEWIGYIGVEKIEGCYYNVMGMPTRLVYKTLNEIATGIF